MRRRPFLIGSIGAGLALAVGVPPADRARATVAERWDGEVIDSVRGPIVVDRPGTVTFGPGGCIVVGAGQTGITVRSSGVTLLDPRVEGPGSTFTGQDASRSSGIAVSAGATGTLDDVQVLGGSVRGFPYAGVLVSGVRGLVLERIGISDIAYSGVRLLSVVGGTVRGCVVSGLHQQDYPNSYGIAATRDTNQSLEDAPRCSDIVIVGNEVRDVPRWEGIDTHGGVRVTIRDNTVVDCATGIALVPLKGLAGTAPDAAPLDALVSGNTVTWTGKYSDTGTMWGAIKVQGAGSTVGSSAERATGAVRGNTISGYGDGTSMSASVFASLTSGLVIADNRITSGLTRGIMLSHSNTASEVVGNTVEDLGWVDKPAYRSAVDVRDAANDVTISDNRAFGSVVATAAHPRYGVYAPGTGSTIRIGRNDWGVSDLPLVPVAQRNVVVAAG